MTSNRPRVVAGSLPLSVAEMNGRPVSAQERAAQDARDAGLDAVYSDHVDRLTETAARYYPPD